MKKLFSFTVIALSCVILLEYCHAGSDETLPRDAAVPTTQSTMDVDSESGLDETPAGLLAPRLDMSNPAHRQRLLANFDSESRILKNRGLSEDELQGLKDAIINGDVEEIKRVYRMKAHENGGRR